MYNENNKLILSGQIMTKPEFVFTRNETNYYGFEISVIRLSDEVDTLKCICVEEKLTYIQKGDNVKINGELNTYNNPKGNPRLVIQVKVNTITHASVEETQENINKLEVNAFVCKCPIARKTQKGIYICDLLLAVNRPNGKPDYIPTIAFYNNAKIACELKVGEKVKCVGRVQSREYQKKICEDKCEPIFETRTAYEYAVSKIKRCDLYE